MPDDFRLPDLSFPNVRFGPLATPWDLRILLYVGGAEARAPAVMGLIDSGALGGPLCERLPLVSRLHEHVSTELASGGSRQTAFRQISCLQYFFAFADLEQLPLTLETVTATYCKWADWLVCRTRNGAKTPPNTHGSNAARLSMPTAYSYAAVVGRILDRILERLTPAVTMTRLERKGQRKTAIGVQAEKQNLGNTFAFGHFLQDICDGLPLQSVLEAPLPIAIPLRSGKSLIRSEHKMWPELTEQVAGLETRYPLANLRIEAELLMFIGQTGMNLAEAVTLKKTQFSYTSHLDGYQVRQYKHRRSGSVLFEIYKDYRPHFERYLDWRRTLFPEAKLVFPFIGMHGSAQEQRFDGGKRIRKACSELGISYVSPRQLRNTRVNWLLRITADPDVTADMAQHAKQTLLTVYERPSLQRAMVQATLFWKKNDPHLDRTKAVAPGDCTGTPKINTEIPETAPKPDCRNGAGCLWCDDHRDVESFDYVWALASFKYLKTIELGFNTPPRSGENVPPAQLSIERMQQKLAWFEQYIKTGKTWVLEANARIKEGHFHPDWHELILAVEEGA